VPDWFAPLAAASLACLLLNVALWVQRGREWPRNFRRELRRWDGRLPNELERE
jgi:hypothetical protein